MLITITVANHFSPSIKYFSRFHSILPGFLLFFAKFMIFPGFPGILSFFKVFQEMWEPWRCEMKRVQKCIMPNLQRTKNQLLRMAWNTFWFWNFWNLTKVWKLEMCNCPQMDRQPTDPPTRWTDRHHSDQLSCSALEMEWLKNKPQTPAVFQAKTGAYIQGNWGRFFLVHIGFILDK